MKRNLTKSMLRFLAQASVVGLITIVLFELCFRIYVIDFYANTFESLNQKMESRVDKPSLLIIGDSFSAFQNGYPMALHDSLSQFRVRNFSVSGTSIKEQYLFGRHHVKREQPDVLIFQFYVGNDFLGWRHQVNWDKISFTRNIYWKLSEKVLSFAYLNRQLSKIQSSTKYIDLADWSEPDFNPDLYTQRDKYYFLSEPGLIENSAYLKGGRDRDFEVYTNRIQDLFAFASDDTRIYFLVIPHCSQVNEDYKQKTVLLGAEFSRQFEPGRSSYPLYDRFVRQFENDKRVRALNPIPFMKEMEEQGNRLYFNNDSHLNQLGQEMIGQYLLKNISIDAAPLD